MARLYANPELCRMGHNPRAEDLNPCEVHFIDPSLVDDFWKDPVATEARDGYHTAEQARFDYQAFADRHGTTWPHFVPRQHDPEAIGHLRTRPPLRPG